jgi:hypothetical protein
MANKKHRNSPRRGPDGRFLKRGLALPNRRHHRNKKRGMFKRLFNAQRHRNPAPSLQGLGLSLVAGTAGYVLTKGVGKLADKYLPESVFNDRPIYRELLGTGLSAFAACWISQTVLANRPQISAAMAVGSVMPVGELALKMSPLGPSLGMFEEAPAMPAPGPASMLPAPGGIQARLRARLKAALRDDDDDSTNWAQGV